jgi:hypothetical protein
MKISRKLQTAFKTGRTGLAIRGAMNWFKRLQQRISGHNSKTGAALKQSEWSRTSIRSVEVTVETDEVFLVERISAPRPEQVSAIETRKTGAIKRGSRMPPTAVGGVSATGPTTFICTPRKAIMIASDEAAS